MLVEEALRDLILRFKKSLDLREAAMNCFCKYGVQLEGWLKGELLSFLDQEKSLGNIVSFDREVLVKHGRKKVDIRIDFSTDVSVEEAWVELKHWLIGYQKGKKYNAQFYFGDASSVGIKQDVEKLNTMPSKNLFLLILNTANPGIDAWCAGISMFNSKFSPLQLISLNSPNDYPSSYFLGLMRVKN